MGISKWFRAFFGAKTPTCAEVTHKYVKDASGEIVGVWLRYPRDAENTGLLEALLHKDGFLLSELGKAVISGRCRTVSNRDNDRGGCFLMAGSHSAPGTRILNAQTQDRG